MSERIYETRKCSECKHQYKLEYLARYQTAPKSYKRCPKCGKETFAIERIRI